MAKIYCFRCHLELKKDQVALCKKLLGRNVNQLMCLHCMAEHLDVPDDFLLVKIEEYKEQGCGLFK